MWPGISEVIHYIPCYPTIEHRLIPADNIIMNDYRCHLKGTDLGLNYRVDLFYLSYRDRGFFDLANISEFGGTDI